MSNCSPASGGGVFAEAAAVMQAVESQTLILYHSDLRGQWPQAPARALAGRLPYAKRLEVAAHAHSAPATLAGIALALRALSELARRAVSASELAFPEGGKPRLAHADAHPAADFSISHSGHWVGCAAVAHGLVGFDVELGGGEERRDWAAREAALKACGLGVAHSREVELHEGGAVCRGIALHATALELFAGAAACLMTSLPVERIAERALPLTELFAHG
jgi:phosphopantetheinyl transferase